MLVTDGSLRVEKTTSNGHEIVLYHVGPGKTCELATCSLLSQHQLTAHAVAETPLTVVRIANGSFRNALEQSPGFRNFIYGSINDGLSGLIGILEQVAFTPTHERLASFLLNATESQHSINLTHQALANELGTAREVVSRLLKDFERHGWVQLSRGEIVVIDASGLRGTGHRPPP